MEVLIHIERCGFLYINMFPLINNLAGQKFDRLLVVRDSGARKDRNVVWECLCDCGNRVNVKGSNLGRGTKSCGCLNRDNTIKRNTIHNMSGMRMHRIWAGMRRRCKNLSDPNYGGRGIKVCKRWDIFINFYRDMRLGYDDNLTIERIDNDGDYEPRNCKWIEKREQNKNQRTNVSLTHKGKTQIMSDWAREVGLSPSTVHYRLKRLPVDLAITTQKHGRQI